MELEKLLDLLRARMPIKRRVEIVRVSSDAPPGEIRYDFVTETFVMYLTDEGLRNPAIVVHEWIHAWLAENVDIRFVAFVGCPDRATNFAFVEMSDATSIAKASQDIVVDYVMLTRIPEVRDAWVEDSMETMRMALWAASHPTLSIELRGETLALAMYMRTVAKALGIDELVRISEEVLERLVIVDPLLERLKTISDEVAELLKRGELVEAMLRFARELCRELLDLDIEWRRVEGTDIPCYDVRVPP